MANIVEQECLTNSKRLLYNAPMIRQKQSKKPRTWLEPSAGPNQHAGLAAMPITKFIIGLPCGKGKSDDLS